MEIKHYIAFTFILYIVCSFHIGIDFNTYSTQELNDAIRLFGHVDFTWTCTINSPGVSKELWKQALAATNNQVTISEDHPMGFNECGVVKSLAGNLWAAFGYHEAHVTQLTYEEITQYANRCNSPVVILTRAYWNGSDWKNNTDKVLHHPKLVGVAMEFNPSDFGKRSQADFVKSMNAAGKVAIFLLPFINVANFPTEKQITNFIQYLKTNGVNLGDSKLWFALARYDKPYIPITGSSNSIDSALKAAQKMR